MFLRFSQAVLEFRKLTKSIIPKIGFKKLGLKDFIVTIHPFYIKVTWKSNILRKIKFTVLLNKKTFERILILSKSNFFSYPLK